MSSPTPEREPVRPDPSAREPRAERDGHDLRRAEAAPVPARTSAVVAEPAASPAAASPAAVPPVVASPPTRAMPTSTPPTTRPAEARPVGDRPVGDRPVGDRLAADASSPAAPADRIPATGAAPRRSDPTPAWTQLQAQFVDDPAAAVKGASALVEEAVERLLQRSGQQDTEELRATFLRYRDLHRSLTS